MASFGTFMVTTCLMLLIMAKIGEGGSVGLNFGRQTSQKLLPSMVVDMLLANGITKCKSFSANEGLMSAFSGTGIQLIVAISNVDINSVFQDKIAKDGVEYWMTRYIRKYRNELKVDIRYICVGVEPFSRIDQEDKDPKKTYVENFIPLMKRIDTTIQKNDDLRGVKLGVPLSDDTVLEPVSKPSEADFHKEFKEKILEILNILNRTDSPFMINIYPYLSVVRERLPLEFGLFDKRSNFTVIDGDLVYRNVFDVKYDTLVHALRKYGYGNVKIMVSQVGWPTDGGPGASVKMAKRFYDGFLKKLASNKGTPLLPGAELDVYLHELVDENQRRIDRGPFERHYGIYGMDGIPKFHLDFTLQGRDFEPEVARGVSYMPQRWCIMDKEAADKAENGVVAKNYKWARENSDCSKLVEGASCSFLEEHWKVSYAFNQFFQMSNQEVMGNAACDFDGLGMVTDKQPTFEGCDFPVQILSTLFINGESNTEMIATLGIESDGGERLGLAYQLMFFVPLLWIVFLQKGRWLGIHVM